MHQGLSQRSTETDRHTRVRPGANRLFHITYFSGNRGHHVQVADSDYDVLDQPARTELVDYLTGKGFTPKVLGFSRDWSNFDVSKLPEKGEPGWRGRFARLITGEGLDAKQAVVALFNTQKDRFPSTIQQIVTPLG